MQRKIKSNRFLALLMALLMLATLIPSAAFTESDMADYLDDAPVDNAADSDDYTEDDPWVDWEEDEPAPEPDYEIPFVESIEGHIADYGYAYVMTMDVATVYGTPELIEPIFTITQLGSVLLATEYNTQNGYDCVKVWFITEGNEVITGYVATNVVADRVLWEDEALAMAFTLWSGVVSSDAGEQYTFVVTGEKPNPAYEDAAIEENASPDDGFISDTADDLVVIPEESADALTSDPAWEPVPIEDGYGGEPFEEAGDSGEPAPAEDGDNNVPDDVEADADLAFAEEPAQDFRSVSVGDYVAVTPKTRAFLSIDDTASDTHDGDLCLGVFVNNATVQIMTIEQDGLGRYWFKVRYTYGDDYADGTMAWVEDDVIYVLASEAYATEEQECSVTDYALPYAPASNQFGIMALAATTPMNGFSLKPISVPIPTLTAGQTGLHGSSGRDSEYPQIATLPGHGTIYATPHYLEGFVVYCLEHTLPSPGGRISGGGTYPTGPFVIVDMDSYRTTPGYSGIIFREQTLHAIAWVMRHTYPFMVLDRNDTHNVTWSRVAGQFAIREVIKQMEGAQYVRDYWHMDNFYAASNQAPAVYLTYARWLAVNGIARGRITGDITITGKSVDYANSTYTGTVRLTTDADLIRIRRSVGTVTGNTAGQDSTYYFLNSGDTIAVSSASNPFTIVAESVNSDAEEANFLIGVPSAAIQKVLIAQYGYPYKMKSVSITFEIPFGSISVTKRGAPSGSVLPGAVFELLNSAGVVVQTLTTGSDGIVRFVNLLPGSYTVREKSAPEGYYVATPDTQNVTVTAGNASNVTFTNNVITGKIKIAKKDQLTKEPLSGAEFTITRLSAPASHNGAGVGQVVAVITTDANGNAETGWLEWGTYRVEETKVPPHYVDNRFSTVIEAYEHGKTYIFEVENEPTKGWIRLTKTDRQNGNPLEGVRFDIYYNDQYGEGYAGSMITDKDGVAISPPLRKGRYIVKEHGETEGYVFELITLDVTVKSDETTDLKVTNQVITSKVRIVKKDQLTKESLYGAEFTITRLSAPPSQNGAVVGQVVAVITTDANGYAETGWLEWGTYLVEETKVPPLYVDNRFSTVIEAYENGKTYTIEVENEPAKGWIRLVKTDRQNGNPIEGVRFDIYYNDQYGEGFAGSMVTDKDGIAISEPLRKGKYIVKEHGETAGYVFEVITLDVTVKSEETTELQATNRHVTIKLKLYKRDVEEYDGENPNASAGARPSDLMPVPADISPPATRGDGVLTGAEFQVRAGEDIMDRQGNVVYAKGAVVVESLKTAGEDVSVTTDELWPGLYEIVELSPPVGYQPSDVSIFVDARSAATQSTEAIVTYEGLKTNKIHYGALAIVKFLGDNKEQTGAGIIEAPEQGAEFEVYLKSAGSYENARGVERDYLVTDRYGRAMTKPLPYGVYVLRQVVGKEGHALMNPIEFMIDGTEDLLAPPTLILNNQARLYRLRIIKIDEETGNTVTLANTAFRLRDADGNLVKQSVHYPVYKEIDTFLTDDSGEVTLPETITWGHYTIEEVQSPKGYLIRPEAISVFIGHAGDAADEVGIVSVEFPNQPVKGHIVLDKKGLLLVGFEAKADAYGNAYYRPVYQEGHLEGVVFEVRAAEDIVGMEGTVWYSEGDLVDTITTTGSGSDRSKELPLGKYRLVEIAAPAGYVFESAPHEANLVFADNRTARVETKVIVGNEYLPAEIALKKEKEITTVINNEGGVVRQIITNVPGEGFVFGLFNDQDIHYIGGTLMADTLMATGTTGVDGFLMFSGYYPHGQYYIKELSAPKGWKMNPKRFVISLDPAWKAADGNVIRVSLPKAVHNELIYTPITITKTDITGEKTIPGAVIEVRNSGGEVIYRAWTDENGHIPDIPITPGVYTFREVYAPEGYALNETEMTFTVDEDGNVTGDTSIRDDYTRFSLLKLGENNQPLVGVEFTLHKNDGALIVVATTDENGLVTFERVPYGSYTIVETKPLPGYLKNDTKIELTVDGYFINPSEPVVTVVNERMCIVGMKVDTSGQYVAGVEFSLIDAVTGEIVESVTSNDSGEFIFTQLDYGDWIIRETKAPEGYSQMEDMHLHVDESWAAPVSFTFTNIPNRYEFLKTDHKDNPLAGVKFTLEDADGNVVCELVSGEDGIVRVTGLTPGVYVIREIETVEGFIRTDETIQIIIHENYVVPDELFRLVNYPDDIQTGFEFTLTPVMWVGVAMVLAAAALAAVHGVQTKKKKGRRVRR